MSQGSGMLPRGRVSAEQLEQLISFMEEHPDFAAGKQSVYSRFSSSKLWRLLTERLNAAADNTSGAKKSPDKWCRYWADIKYKARKKSAAGGALGELSVIEERLNAIIANSGGVVREGKCKPRRDSEPAESEPSDMCSEGSGGAGAAGGGGASTEELLAEAAMRSALAAERQAEAVLQGVQVLREILCVLRPLAGVLAPPAGVLAPPAAAAAPPPPDTHHNMHHAHHHTHHTLN